MPTIPEILDPDWDEPDVVSYLTRRTSDEFAARIIAAEMEYTKEYWQDKWAPASR